MKKLRLFPNSDRVTRTRIVYIALTAGTVAAALLLVLLNRWIFRLTEAGLYDDPKYEAVSIISADSIGEPLPLPTRVSLYLQCERQGDERAVMPDEADADAITEELIKLWTDTLHLHAPDGRLASGESVDAVLRKSRYTVTLRDFYSDKSGAKLALWCAQAYYTASGGRTYCLSVLFDSRTCEAYFLSCALYENVRTDRRTDTLKPFLITNGYDETLAGQAEITPTERGFFGTLTLPDGLSVSIVYAEGEQYEITFTE